MSSEVAPFPRVRSEPQFAHSAVRNRRASVDTGLGSRVSSGASSTFSGSPPSGSICSLAPPSKTLSEKIYVSSSFTHAHAHTHAPATRSAHF